MKKIISVVGRVLNLVLLVGLTSFVCVEVSTHRAQQQKVFDGYSYNVRETGRILAVQDAQNYATPILRVAENLSDENKMLRVTVAEAKRIVAGVHEENEQTKKALHDSIKMLGAQIEENNRCVDLIRQLEQLVASLLERLPVIQEKQD